MALSVDQITAPVLIASSSSTNASMNNNLSFLADFNKIHEQNSLSKSATTSNLLKHKSYSFLMSKQIAKKIGSNGQSSSGNSNNLSLSVMNPTATSSSTTTTSSSISSNLSNFNPHVNCLTHSMTNFNSTDQNNSYSTSTLTKRTFIKAKTSL
jgi:hypothetical protein